MRKIILALALAAVAPAVHAAQTNPFSGFAQYASENVLKPFALDLGGLLGAATVDSGRTYGCPGFWVGGDGALQARPDSNDQILRYANVRSFALPLVQAGVGLPYQTDVVLHGMGAYGVAVFGGGVRKSLYRTSLVSTFLPNLSVSAFGDKVNAGAFNASHGALNAIATWDLPIVKPFVEAGYDFTKVVVGAAQARGLAGVSATANGGRLAGGVDLTPLPLLDLRLALLDLHGIIGGQLGLGVKF
jgi:hypothetical protein